ncbi:MAG: hypothetical protein Q9N62_07245 [Ghiorsea sp.]|nr:hypothetical protein [Ghiorsea sp.]
MMEGFWKAALKATGSVAVVGIILWVLVHFLFQEEILSLFDSAIPSPVLENTLVKNPSVCNTLI